MNIHRTVWVFVLLACVVLLASFGVLFFGSPEQVARIPSSALVAAVVTILSGSIYLHATKPRSPVAKKSNATISTIAFAILVVVTILMAVFFLNLMML